MYSDKGFTIYKGNKVAKKTDGVREFVFKDIDNNMGDSLKHKHNTIVRNVKKIIQDINSLTSNTAVFCVGNVNSPLLS